MKKHFRLLIAVVAISIFVSAGTLWAGPVAPLCPAHGTGCIEKDGNMYCRWIEETRVNKLVPGRAGMWQWQLVPTYQLKTEKCQWM